MLSLSLFPALFSLLCLPALSSPLPADTKASPVPPSEDPWYTAPDGFETASPGTVLRIRYAPGNLTTVFSNSSAAYNILYRTSDTHYQPSWAVTTLFVPKSTKGTELLSYQIPYNSVDLDASPSYLLYAPITPLSELLHNDIQTSLSMGWYVNIPDFEGPLASFAEGVQEGIAVLDSVRAVLNTDCGLADDAKYALWGYSGGSLASEWATELQAQYAPELEFAGAALGGLVSSVADIYQAVTGTRWAGLIPETLLGVTSQYPEAHQYLLSQLKTSGTYNKTGFLAVKEIDISEAFELFAGQDIFKYFKNGENVLKAPAIQAVLDQETYMGYHGVPKMPLYIYKAIADEITDIQGTDELVDRYCAIGVNILYERNSIGGHLAEETNGDSSALEWLAQVLSGTYQHDGCTIRNVAINVIDSPL